MKTFRLLSILTLALALTAGVTSCKKVSDADLKKAAEAVLATTPGASNVAVAVKDKVATLSGTVEDDAIKASAENAVKGVKEMKSVINEIAVLPPAPDYTQIDAALRTGLNDVVKDHNKVTYEVKDGVVTLSGEIQCCPKRFYGQ